MLQIDNIRVAYGKTVVIHGLSLEVGDGELVALVGANGAGKSTTLRTISGLLHPLEGSVIYNGKTLNKMHPDQVMRLGIAHCPEGRHVWHKMSVEENLIVGGHILPKHEMLDQIEKMYEMFPILKERKSQLAGSLSGGEQQMLAIARAIMTRPTLLLFDEPSLGLAPVIVEQVMEIISRINKENKVSVLLVEQNANMALAIADRAYVLESGLVTLSGDASDLRNNDQVRKAYLSK